MTFSAKNILLSCLFVAVNTPTVSLAAGIPIIIAEIDTSGSLLDFFDISGPSGIKEISVAGTVSSEFGATGTVGQNLSFHSSVGIGSITGDLTLGGNTIEVFEIGGTGSFDFDPFQLTPGLITYDFLAILPVASFSEDSPTPGETTFEYSSPWSIFGPFTTTELYPDRELRLEIFYDGIFPTKTHVETADDGTVIDTFPYVEGPFAVTKIVLSTIGGAEPIAAVPLPASLPLMVFSLGALGFARRKRA